MKTIDVEIKKEDVALCGAQIGHLVDNKQLGGLVRYLGFAGVPQIRKVDGKRVVYFVGQHQYETFAGPSEGTPMKTLPGLDPAPKPPVPLASPVKP